MQRSVTNIHSVKINLISIKGFEAFARIYQNAKKFHSDNISIAYVKPENALLINNKLSTKLVSSNLDSTNPENINSANLYFGVTISKKNCKKAVVRNRIKRLLREALAQFFIQNNTLHTSDNSKGINLLNNAHIVFSARYKLTTPSLIHLQDIQPEINYLLRKILNQK